jgi:SpoVK/Ycf46/Vps4 family AAA+-type ATPase
VATGEQLKSLVDSHAAGDDARFRSVVLQIAAHAAEKGKTILAKDLKALVESVRRPRLSSEPRPVPIVRPEGQLNDLFAASYPKTRLSDMVLPAEALSQLHSVVHEYRQRDRLRSYGLSPKRKLLLSGPPGCGKTMTASALAGETSLPLMFVQLHAVITKYMGETASKLKLIFDSMQQMPGVYLFDEFDAIGSFRGGANDVGEMRRVLNSFLQMLERDDSDSIVIAATNLSGMLDEALFRRFDETVRYSLPARSAAELLLRNRLAAFATIAVDWPTIASDAVGLSHAEIVKAAEQAAKDVLLDKGGEINTGDLKLSIEARRRVRTDHPNR